MNYKLGVLSYSAGQESWSILLGLVYSKLRQCEDLLVLMSDTGDEHPETYVHVDFTRRFCKHFGIEFQLITPDLGFHYDKWPDLRSFYRRTNTVGSKAFPKTCTDKLKIQPIYKFLDTWVGKKYGYKSGRGKPALKEFAKDYGKIQMMIGLSATEEKRIASKRSLPVWQNKSIRIEYPLIRAGMTRKDTQDFTTACGYPVPIPSNCLLCPFMNDIELVWLFRRYPADFRDWVAIEHNKLMKNQHMGEKNYGVWGRKTLPQVLEEALKKYGDWPMEKLMEYKMSHGSCTQSKY